jgi:hypothetical protein
MKIRSGFVSNSSSSSFILLAERGIVNFPDIKIEESDKYFFSSDECANDGELCGVFSEELYNSYVNRKNKDFNVRFYKIIELTFDTNCLSDLDGNLNLKDVNIITGDSDYYSDHYFKRCCGEDV